MRVRIALFLLAILTPATPVQATDVDGPDDCNLSYTDFGDAPESIPAYPSAVPGAFPTCSASGPTGTQELFCPAISTAPGPAGFVIHRTPQADNFWLGCYGGAPGTELGLDSESDGKVATPAAGVSTCSGISTDCIETAFGGMTFDQDECYFDGSDAGLQNPQTYIVCSTPTFTIDVYACAPRNIILNVLVDWNEDGDWNDTFDCSPGCAYEWAVKNHTVALTAGCNTIVVPPFLVGPNPGYGWMRISVSENPAADDYPWNGTLSMVQFLGGETEDYPVVITDATPTDRSSWGRVKTLYR